MHYGNRGIKCIRFYHYPTSAKMENISANKQTKSEKIPPKNRMQYWRWDSICLIENKCQANANLSVKYCPHTFFKEQRY